METRNLLRLASVAILLLGGIAPMLRADDFRYVRPSGSRSLIWQPRDNIAFVGNQFFVLPGNISSQPDRKSVV